jgi:hypothetical protein
MEQHLKARTETRVWQFWRASWVSEIVISRCRLGEVQQWRMSCRESRDPVSFESREQWLSTQEKHPFQHILTDSELSSCLLFTAGFSSCLLLAVFFEFFAAGTRFEVSDASLAVDILRLDLRGASNSSLSDCFALRFGIFGCQLPS